MPDYDGDATREPRDVFGRPIVNDNRFEAFVVQLRADEAAASVRLDGDTQHADKPLWTNSLGQPVDLDNIDRQYAIRILAHLAGHYGAGSEALVEKLVEVATNGRAPTEADLARARAYNDKNKALGLPWRAPDGSS